MTVIAIAAFWKVFGAGLIVIGIALAIFPRNVAKHLYIGARGLVGLVARIRRAVKGT